MSGVISIGGLASGLDTNKIVDQLVQLERQPIDLLNQQIAGIQQTQTAIGGVSSRLATIRAAAAALSTKASVLARAASSSDSTVLSAAAGAGASRGSATIVVSQLARGSVAGSTVGLSSADALVAAGTGTFRFQVGSGDVQSVGVDGTTTLQDLANSINGLGAGVTASAINVGTTAAPDWRLQVASQTTGASSTITVVQDDTTLAVQTAQSGQNAAFTVTGFTATFQRESNTFSDVLPGVTIALRNTGTATVTVNDDTDAIVGNVKTLVNAYNDLRTFVASQSTVEESDTKDTVTAGPLASDSTARLAIQSVQQVLTGAVGGTTGQYRNLASLGLATQLDGTIVFDESTFRDALASNPDDVAAVFAGADDTGGVGTSLTNLVDDFTKPDGALTIHTNALGEQISSIQASVDLADRNSQAFEANLRAQFASLETLVSSLQSQGNSLLAALGAK